MGRSDGDDNRVYLGDELMVGGGDDSTDGLSSKLLRNGYPCRRKRPRAQPSTHVRWGGWAFGLSRRLAAEVLYGVELALWGDGHADSHGLRARVEQVLAVTRGVHPQLD